MAFFNGALVPTFGVSRLFLWLTRTWNRGLNRLLAVHAASLLLAGFIAGMGMADGGAFAGPQGIAQYALPQLVWLVFDVVRHRRQAAA